MIGRGRVNFDMPFRLTIKLLSSDHQFDTRIGTIRVIQKNCFHLFSFVTPVEQT